MDSPLDRFIPQPDVRERFHIIGTSAGSFPQVVYVSGGGC